MKVYLVAFLILLSGVVHAGNTYTGVDDYYTISEIIPFSSVDPLNSNLVGKTQIKFTSSINWLG